MYKSLIAMLLALPLMAAHLSAFAQSPVTAFDGEYSGTMAIVGNPSNKSDCNGGPYNRTLSIRNGSVSFVYNATRGQQLSGTVSADGTISAFGAAASGGNKLTAKVQGNTITGEIGSAYCQYALRLTKTR